MKKIMHGLTLCVLFASWGTPALAAQDVNAAHAVAASQSYQSARQVQGGVTHVAPLASQIGALRLPPQAGKVSNIVTTNLIPRTISWIVKGDKYYSLCVPNGLLVSCAPIVATSVMREIDVGTRINPNGEPFLT